MNNNITSSSYDDLTGSRVMYSKEVNKYTDGSIKKFVKQLLWKEETIVTDIDIMYSDALDEDDLRKQLQQSDNHTEIKTLLSIKKRDGYFVPEISTISGLIHGKNVKIKKIKKIWQIKDDVFRVAAMGSDRYISYEWTIDGVVLDPKEAEVIYSKYLNVALDRTKRLNDVVAEKNITNKRKELIKERKIMVEGILS